MDADNLIHMANRIGQFFEAQPDRAEALQGIATHLARFWTPAMRQQLEAHVAAGGAGLLPVVREALQAPPPP